MYFVSFGRFKNLSKEELQEEKKIFLDAKKNSLSSILYNEYNKDKFKEYEESEINKMVKEKIQSKNSVEELRYILVVFGMNYDLLSDGEKKQLVNMDLTYDNYKNFVVNNFNKYIRKAKKECPNEIYECFNEQCFVAYCQLSGKEIKKSNFLSLIKKYFILDSMHVYIPYRDNEKFKKIRDKMIKLYPQLKDEYGRSRAFDKFMSFFEPDNDYNNELLNKILDEYYDKKENKYINLKQDED